MDRIVKKLGVAIKPKHCPFCDFSGITVYRDTDAYLLQYYAECNYCGAKSGYYASAIEAIKAWNTRYGRKA